MKNHPKKIELSEDEKSKGRKKQGKATRISSFTFSSHLVNLKLNLDSFFIIMWNPPNLSTSLTTHAIPSSVFFLKKQNDFGLMLFFSFIILFKAQIVHKWKPPSLKNAFIHLELLFWVCFVLCVRRTTADWIQQVRT